MRLSDKQLIILTRTLAYAFFFALMYLGAKVLHKQMTRANQEKVTCSQPIEP